VRIPKASRSASVTCSKRRESGQNEGAAKAAPFLFSMPAIRHSPLDQLLIAADEALRAISGGAAASRPSPAGAHEEGDDPRTSAGLMRVNHAGEICAQALYSGQAFFARDERVRAALRQAAAEERDHLAWCEARLEELGSRPSVLSPLWYAGSFG